MGGKAGKIDLNVNFYRGLGITDDALIENLDQAIELYLGVLDKKGADSTMNFDKAIGMFTVSFQKIAHTLFKLDPSKFEPKHRLCMDFGYIDPRIVRNMALVEQLAAECTAAPSSGAYEKYYMSEWLEKIGRGAFNLTSDAAQVKSKSHDQDMRDKVLKKVREVENILEDTYRKEHESLHKLATLFKSIDTRSHSSERLHTIHSIRVLAHELEGILKEQVQKHSEIDILNTRLGITDERDFTTVLDEHRADQYRRIRDEFEMLNSVMRSCAVRGGIVKNTPVLIDKWLPPDLRTSVNTKSQVDDILSQLEALDPTIFVSKSGKRLPPKIVILPGNGAGMAWPDRIMISVISPATVPSDISLIRTLAQYRWYIATTSYKWKDIPGELGSSYQVLNPDKILTNLQKAFVEDYEKWMTKESQGFQVLNPEVRKLFWKHMPFSNEMKLKLSGRAAIYKQLHAAEKAKSH